MKTIFAVSALALLAGCANMTERQKQTLALVGGVLVVGAVAAHQADHGDSSTPIGVVPGVGPGPSCSVQPNGSCR